MMNKLFASTHIRFSRTIVTAMVVACLALGAGCVRRTLTVNTEPQGALVWLNDEEIGRSPATVDFLWYGDYGVTARMPGYQTLIAHEEIKAPWYQWAGVDFFTEILYPGWIHDHREMSFDMAQATPPDHDELLENARAFREQALAEQEEPPAEVE